MKGVNLKDEANNLKDSQHKLVSNVLSDNAALFVWI